MEQTLALIKPDAVERNIIGKILIMIENDNFKIRQMKLTQMSEQLAKTFYSVHEGKSFYEKLIKYMTSGNIIALVLEKENAVASYRQLIGATDPTKADDNTIRKLYALDKSFNSVHGSDSIENAKLEISIIFGD
jgi:nucleoside-diphosphate kinase